MWPNIVSQRYAYPTKLRRPVHHLQSHVINASHLPSSVDLRKWMTPVEDQKDMNTCVANAFAGACEYFMKKSTGNHIDVSRLFVNYNGRLVESPTMTTQDVGSSLIYTAIALRRYGICEEAIWKYDRKNLNQRPSDTAYMRGSQFTVTVVKLQPTLIAMKTVLAKKLPFVVSIVLLESARQEGEERNGYILMPNPADPRVKHAKLGHAVLIVGYDDETQHFIVRNSWGSDWGHNGYFFIPYQYLLNPKLFLADEGLWIVKNISFRQRYSLPIRKVTASNSYGSCRNYQNRPSINQIYPLKSSSKRSVRYHI
ncbi:unnamed protein product [Rotaria sp. Silwood2]|nr:unnamed protein product [Rotaria sp. Silwood2]